MMEQAITLNGVGNARELGGQRRRFNPVIICRPWSTCA